MIGLVSFRQSDAGETIPVGASGAGGVESAASPRPGVTVGRYLVIGTLGTGAMGQVVHAYDPKLQREVALKILRTQTLGEEAQTRLIREARAMAKLAHPNVVAVYDVERDPEQGTVVAMEYVAGRTLKQWVKDESPSPRQVVEAFVPAGRGLAAAHEAGLLHRDFKPDNVLVGDDGRVRVTDFGLARIDRGGRDPSTETGSPKLQLAEDLTAFGTVLGTPRYMAPEQHGVGELTAAADQFAFCVSLWELLCGVAPYTADTLDQLALGKCEGPPAWPKGVALPRSVVDAIRRGLAADPDARWPSVLALVAALDGGYVRRRRNRIVLASVGVISSIGATAVALWPDTPSPCTDARTRLADAWSDERRDRVRDAILGTELAYAASTWDAIAPALDAYADAWVEQHTDACLATHVRLEQSEDLLDARMGCLQNAQQRLDATTHLFADADEAVVERAAEIVAGLPSLSPCADVEYLRAAVPPPPPELAPRVAEVRRAIADAASLRLAGKYEASAQAVARGRELAADLDYPPVDAQLALAAGTAHERLGEYEPAEAAFAEALQGALAAGLYDEAQAAASSLVMTVGAFRQQPDRGLDFAVTARGLLPRTSQPRLRQAELHRVLGSVYDEKADYPRAVEELRQAVSLVEADPESDPLDVAAMRLSLGNALKLAGDLEGAQAEQHAVADVRRRELGDRHPRTGNALHNLANTLALRGDLEAAAETYAKALEIFVATLGPDHPTVAASRSNRAGVLEELGHEDKAFEEFRTAMEGFAAALGPDHPKTAMARHNYALRLGKRGDHATAAAQLRDVIAVLQPKLGDGHPVVATAHINLGIELEESGDLEGAIEAVRTASKMREAVMNEDHIELAEVRVQLARLLVKAGRVAEARPLAEAGWKVYRRGDGTATRRGQAAFELAKVRRAQGSDPAVVVELTDAAIEIFEAGGAPESADVVRAWVTQG